MGTNYMLKCAVTPENSAGMDRDVQAILEQFDRELSNWNPDSWVSRFNRSESTGWQDAPESVIRILEQSKAIHALSLGAFDTTISPLIELWGFGAEAYRGTPSQAEIEAQLKRVGMARLELDLVGIRIRKTHPDLTINCSAIAKGTAVDLIADYLSGQGIERYLIEIGGEIRTSVPELDPDSWTVGIRKPEAGFAQLQTSLELRTAAMATSGDYLNFTEVDGVRYAHIIDPTNGRPVPYGLHSVTVIAENCATADALATACLVMGSQKALKLIERMDQIEAYLLQTGSDGSIQVLKTSGLSAYEH
jgi:thiamine biosynthesis lipoprotein